jgi:protein-disulfide isomerase
MMMAAGAGLLIFVLAMWFVLAPRAGAVRSDAELAALQRPHAAVLGNPDAKVHIVEFMDPACDTCRQFYPLVKGLMSDNRARINLSIRLVAFHRGADAAVKALEASKLQGKFETVLERLLAAQPKWVVQHAVDASALWDQLQSLDLDVAKLKVDMESPAVLNNVSLDAQDARTLKVVQTPEYFVNGRGLPEFGYDYLRQLVIDEIAKSYP